MSESSLRHQKEGGKERDLEIGGSEFLGSGLVGELLDGLVDLNQSLGVGQRDERGEKPVIRVDGHIDANGVISVVPINTNSDQHGVERCGNQTATERKGKKEGKRERNADLRMDVSFQALFTSGT